MEVTNLSNGMTSQMMKIDGPRVNAADYFVKAGNVPAMVLSPDGPGVLGWPTEAWYKSQLEGGDL